MFTGIIENTGHISEINQQGTNISFKIKANFSDQLKVDQSLSHNGVCLTVEKIWPLVGQYQVTAIAETLNKTTLGFLKIGDEVNLERCLKADGRFDGHIVQGHVDQIGICEAIYDRNGSWQFDFSYDPSLNNITVEKGSICLNGVSLTVFNSVSGRFSVAIIPYTYQHTNFKNLKLGEKVNLEFDIIGKYLAQLSKPYK